VKNGSLARLGARFRPERRRIAAVVALAFISAGFSVAGPGLLGLAINVLFDGYVGKRLPVGITKAQAIAALRAHGNGQVAAMLAPMNVVPGAGVDLTRVGQLLGLAVSAYLLSAVASWAQAYLMAGIAQRTVYRLRQAVEQKLARLPLRYFDSHPHGDILSRVTNDLDNLTSTLQDGLGQLVSIVLTLVGALGVMFWISPVLALVSLVTIPLTIAITALVARRSRTQFAALWQRAGRLNGHVEETHTGHALVLAFGQREAVIEEFDRQNEELRKVTFRAQVLSWVIQPAVQFLGNLNYVIIAALGGYQVATGAITLGGVQALIQYSRQFSGSATEGASLLNMIQSGLASSARVFDFLDEPDDAVTDGAVTDGAVTDGAVTDGAGTDGAGIGGAGGPGQARVRVAPWLQLRQVRFRYEPDKPLIEDFTLDVAPGQTVAIVGPTGAGKTTIVNLLMRFYEINGGSILLDGTDYRDLTREQVRRHFAMVLQDTWLFAGTIRENIAYGRAGATDEEIIAAAQAAHVDHFVRTLPDGYATVLDGDASGLSSGQRQLVTIARAFLADPGVLILDEATSNVDTRTETLIQNAMTRLRSGRTSFVIAHRLSTIRDADIITVMDEGRIVAQGNHEELLARPGLYHDLYNSQFTEALVS
jgi:ABC-type multidrug transport system fused ATPase/permease subunit